MDHLARWVKGNHEQGDHLSKASAVRVVSDLSSANNVALWSYSQTEEALGGGIQHVADCLAAYLARADRNDALLMQYADRIRQWRGFQMPGLDRIIAISYVCPPANPIADQRYARLPTTGKWAN